MLLVKKKICISGPVWTNDLFGKKNLLPRGSFGAPHLSRLIKEFSNNFHEVSVVTLSNDIKKTKIFKIRNINIIYCPLRKHSFRFNGKYLGRAIDFFYQEIKSIKKAYEIIQPDLILSNWAYEYSYAAYKSKFRYIMVNQDIPHIVLKYIPNLYRLIRSFMSVIVLKNSKNIITPSIYAKIQTQKYTSSKIRVIGNPVANNIKTKKINKIKKISKILMINNGFNKRKNVKIAILSFLKLKESYPDLSLHIYGNEMQSNGACYNWIKKNNFKTKDIFLNGPINTDILMKKIHKYDIYLSTALEETFGTTFVESLKAGVPIIAGKNSGSPKYVVQNCGQLIDVTDMDKIIKSIKKYLDNIMYWKVISLKSKNYSKKYDVKNIYKKYHNFIVKVINE